MNNILGNKVWDSKTQCGYRRSCKFFNNFLTMNNTSDVTTHDYFEQYLNASLTTMFQAGDNPYQDAESSQLPEKVTDTDMDTENIWTIKGEFLLNNFDYDLSR